MKTVWEQAAEISVFDEADVVVVGGGCAGTSAAIAAARCGAKVILIERYGFLGGLVTGGQVIMIPNIDNGRGVYCGGILQEWMDRLGSKYQDSVCGPRKEDAGNTDPELVKKWSLYSGCTHQGRVIYTTFVDPELLKIELCNMLSEAGVTTYLHCWGTKALMENGELKGVIFESKEGRHAILGKVIVDATGEGDVFSSAGESFDINVNPKIRNSNTTECFRIDHIDWEKYSAWKMSHLDEHKELLGKIGSICGFSMIPIPSNRNDECWINNWLSNRDSMKVKDLTDIEFTVKRRIPEIIRFFRENFPGFENAALMDIASVVGVRHSRRIHGLYQVTMDDLLDGREYEDAVVITPPMHSFNHFPDSINDPNAEIPMWIPYQALIPQHLNNLIVGGRCLCADVEAHNWLNLIPHSVLTGQAAGTAAALSVQDNVQPRDLNIRKLQTYLKAQNIYLPMESDPSVKVELVQAKTDTLEKPAEKSADEFYSTAYGMTK